MAELQAEIEEYLVYYNQKRIKLGSRIEPSTIQSSIFKLTNLSNFGGQIMFAKWGYFFSAPKATPHWFAALTIPPSSLALFP